MNEEKKSKSHVEKLIRFFKGLSGTKPKVSKEEYRGRDQTEEEYQKEQAEWLRKVEKIRRKREGDKGEGN